MHSDELSERAITSLKGIGPARAEQFARMGLFSLRDLLGFMPRGYLDFSRERCISDIEDGEAAAVHVEFIGPARTIRAKNGTVVTNVSIGDSSGNMTAVWFNQSFMQRNIPREPGGYILGFMDKKHGARFVRAVFSETLPGVLPVYPLVRGLTQSVVRNAVRAALDACGTGMQQETLPRSVLSEFNLISLKHAIHSVHFPHDAEELRQARRRLAFEDALMLTIVLQMLRQERGRERGIAFETGGVRNDPVIGSITLGDPLPDTDPEIALRIYYAQAGEEVFAVARRFHVAPAQILAANQLEEELACLPQAQRLLIPVT